MEINSATNAFLEGVTTAWKYADIDENISRQLPSINEISFGALNRLIQNSLKRKEAARKKKTRS